MNTEPKENNIDVYIDRGGTFTDCVFFRKNKWDAFKVPSSNESIADCLLKTANSFDKIPLHKFNRIIISSTLATNALLEESGPDIALLVTTGFKDVLRIGDQRRPDLFNINIPNRNVVYKHVFEVDGRITLNPSKLCQNKKNKHFESPIVHSNIDTVISKLQSLGIKHVALSLVHSVIDPSHELQVFDILSKNGFSVTLSHEYPIRNYLNRTLITVLNSYLTPVISHAMSILFSKFDDPLAAKSKVFMMTSNGAIKLATSVSGIDALLSGPAGGLISLESLYSAKIPKDIGILSVDMGGTSTDLSRYQGVIERKLEYKHNDLLIALPFVDINTIAAGGGSALLFVNGLLKVGPQSVGSHPGPLMYDKCGTIPSVSDANAVLGFLQPDFFPRCFGLDNKQPLNINKSIDGLTKLASEINAFYGNNQSIYQIAHGFLEIACHKMAAKIKSITQYKGYTLCNHILDCFGGAGSQIICKLADLLKIDTILIHHLSSVQSAYGLSQSNIMVSNAISTDCMLSSNFEDLILKIKNKNDAECREIYKMTGNHKVFINCRYQGSNTELEVPYEHAKSVFEKEHSVLFGFKLNRDIQVTQIRVRTTIEQPSNPCMLYDDYLTHKDTLQLSKAQFIERKCHFGNDLINIPFYHLNDIQMSLIHGPCILYDANSTIVIYPGYSAYILKDGVVLNKSNFSKSTLTEFDPSLPVSSVELSVFSNRFMAIAEEMGQSLQKTAISVNIKERLDFSCALFNAKGELISNAPHIPIHLGSMSKCVQEAVIKKHQIKQGDVFCTNTPQLGGSHLPDITVISPIFENNKLIGFTASRAHHADIGSISPGSMPSHSKYLHEEGAIINSVLIVKNGEFKSANLSNLIEESRNPDDNISDLKAQVAANTKGGTLTLELATEMGFKKMNFFMNLIIDNAQLAVQSFLKDAAGRLGDTLEAVDYMDDGSRIKLKIKINIENGTADFDFTGTSPQGYHNLNAPPAIASSAVLYCLRCLINEEMPLNQGCLKPINLILPNNSLINPNFDTEQPVAVVGGNVMTSQRIVDVVFHAFLACGASQGCCNNLTFGIDKGSNKFGCYETICGGSGATAQQDGKDAVHTHMTNTRISDVEVMEGRYHVVLHQFEIRGNSGGEGMHRGGHGVIRNIEFCVDDVQVNILSERRSLAPYGLFEGSSGQRGINTWINQGMILNIGGKNSFKVKKHDQVIIETPGGGGYGKSK